MPRILLCIVSLTLLAAACASPPVTIAPKSTLAVPRATTTAARFSSLMVGWVYEAYPSASLEQMKAEMSRMRANGATAVWLGHNNPGEVDVNKVEPGLSYAVWDELLNGTPEKKEQARQMGDAVRRALEAARAAELKVVLPIGYQIMMGERWNTAHPDDLRRDAAGNLLEIYGSGPTASPYSGLYRRDIRRFYEWIQSEWVEPFEDVIVMLSLADEPMGGDYSAAAALEFERRYGVAMQALPQEDEWKLGEFQAGVIADYAAWSAALWEELNPTILTTMSFHGGETARRTWGLPEIERLFSQTPRNFVVTFDAYLHDDLPSKPATPLEGAQLKLFLTTIGAFSRIYDKPLALWGAANSWGLAQESVSPLGVHDAVTNLRLLYDLPRQAGGGVWGVFAWNYNVRGQGLYNYQGETSYKAIALESAVSKSFGTLRQLPKSAPRGSIDAVILVPAAALYSALGTARTADVPPTWFDTADLAMLLADRTAAIAASPQSLHRMGEADYWIVPEFGEHLDRDALELLRQQHAKGKTLLVDRWTALKLGLEYKVWKPGWSRLPDASAAVFLIED